MWYWLSSLNGDDMALERNFHFLETRLFEAAARRSCRGIVLAIKGVEAAYKSPPSKYT